MDKRRKEYNEYLSSDAWKELRQRVLKRDNFKCTKCGEPPSKGNWLEVHHLHYHTFMNEALEDLTALCKNCHEDFHKGQRYRRKRRKEKKERRQKKKAEEKKKKNKKPPARTYQQCIDGIEKLLSRGDITEKEYQNALKLFNKKFQKT